MKRFWWVGLIVVAVAVGVGVAVRWLWFPPVSFQLEKSEKGGSFIVELGRGSGRDGLNTIRVDQDGTAVVIRDARKSEHEVPNWQKATIHLSPEAVAEVVDVVDRSRVLALQRKYSDGSADGNQWIVRIRQGSHDQSMYFDNEFPEAVRQFAKELDGVLSKSGLVDADWQPLSTQGGAEHDSELWKSIR